MCRNENKLFTNHKRSVDFLQILIIKSLHKMISEDVKILRPF